jgi:hypothetical protein
MRLRAAAFSDKRCGVSMSLASLVQLKTRAVPLKIRTIQRVNPILRPCAMALSYLRCGVCTCIFFFIAIQRVNPILVVLCNLQVVMLRVGSVMGRDVFFVGRLW